MKKLSIIALSRDAKAVMDELAWLACVEIEKSTDESAKDLTYEDLSAERADFEQKLAALKKAIPILSPFRKTKRGLAILRPIVRKEAFATLPAEAEDAIAAALRLTEIERRLSELAGEETGCKTSIRSLTPWQGCSLSLDFDGTEQTRVLFGTVPVRCDMDALSAALSAASDGAVTLGVISEDAQTRYLEVITHVSTEKDVQAALAASEFTAMRFPRGTGFAEEALAEKETALAALAEERMALTEEKRALAAHCDQIEIASDLLSTRLAILEAQAQTGRTETTVVITGWMPAKAEARLSKALSPFICSYELTDPSEDDNVPVKLQNSRFADPFESLIGLYSYPKYGTYDPTLVAGVWFAIFFGLMSADVGYGLLTIIGSLLFLKLRKPRLGTARFLKMFAICGVSSVITGVLFNGWFGDLPSQFAEKILGIENFGGMWHLLDPIEDPIVFFILSLAFGVVHLLFGMAINMIRMIKRGEVFAAIFDIGSWFVVYIGLGLYFLIGMPGAIMALVGVAMVVLTHGRAQKNIFMKLFSGILGLYDIVSFMSDVLSYSRVLALGLSSAVIASVFNVLATLGGQSWISIILFPLIFVLGHVLNLALGLLSAFIHASRLQYVEFFGKFYEDGGRPFRPIAPQLTYTDISAEDVS